MNILKLYLLVSVFTAEFSGMAHAQMPTQILGKGMIDAGTKSMYVGLECVGGPPERRNCWSVQPVLIGLQDQKVLLRGNVLVIQDLVEDNDGSNPGPAEVHEFLKDLDTDFLEYLKVHQSKRESRLEQGILVGGMLGWYEGTNKIMNSTIGVNHSYQSGAISAASSLILGTGAYFLVSQLMKKNLGFSKHGEIIDTKDWNWNENAKQVKSRKFEKFKNFLMSYRQPVSRN